MIHAKLHKPEVPRCLPIISGLGPSSKPSEPSKEEFLDAGYMTLIYV